MGFVGVQQQTNLGLFSAIGGLIRGGANFLTGGLSETAIQLGSQLVSGRQRQGPRAITVQQPPVFQVQQPRVAVPTPGFGGAVERFLPGGRSGFIEIPQPTGPGGVIGLFPGVPGGVTGFAEDGVQMVAECPKGFRRNRTSYFIKSGEFVPARSRCVRIRRNNPDNGRASSRAARRLLSRKKHQDRIDKALAAIAPRSRTRTKKATNGKPQIIVAGN